MQTIASICDTHSIKNAPAFLAVGPGSDLYALAIDCVIGYMMSPPRAEADGIPGPNTTSDKANP